MNIYKKIWELKNEKKSNKEIKQMLGISSNVLSYYVCKGPYKEETKDILKIKEIINLKNKGLTVKNISKKLNIGLGTVGYYLKLARNKNIEYIKIKPSNKICKEKLLIAGKKRRETCNKNLLNKDFNKLSFDSLRKRVILEQNNKCNKCNLDSWLNKPLVLELEHIDGNNKNNLRENLEALCPNCHSQTNTWRGKNKIKNKRNKITDEQILEKLIEFNFNIRQTLISLNLSPKGGNYKRIYRISNDIK